MHLRLLQKFRYQPVSANLESSGVAEDGFSVFEKSPVSRREQKGSSVRTIFIMIGSLLVGFLMGFHVPKDANKCDSVPTNNTQQTENIPSWTLDIPRVHVSYSKEQWRKSHKHRIEPPKNNSTEPIWDALMPKGQGFIRYPEDNPDVQVISSMHQMHCLYIIRRGFYAEPGVSIGGVNQNRLIPTHFAHCFDYIRQALMCAADGVLEPYREFAGGKAGVNGWGFNRVCRNYEELKEFAEEWRTNDNEGYLESGPTNGHVHDHETEDELVSM